MTKGSKKDKSVERESNIQKAISYYFSHEESIRVVAKRFEIHPSTFHGRLNGQHGPQIGRPSLLSVKMETTIKMLLMELNDFGYGYGKKNFLNIMNFHSKAHPELRLPTFGKKWVNGFQERHPEISLRIAGKTNTSRQVACQPKEMDFFFKEVEKLLTEKCITQPTHMFNCDESGMTFSEGKIKVFAKRGSKDPKKLSNENDKKMVTILACCSASGLFLPTNVFYKGKYLMKDSVIGGPPGTKYTVSQSGWMEKDTFFAWFKDIFLKSVENLDGWKVLFLDGHSSHISLDLLLLAKNKQVSIVKLPPHTSNLLQPLSVGVFGPMKKAWREVFGEFIEESQFSTIINKDFPPLLKIAQERSFTRQNAIAGFCNSGLYPLNREKITEEKLKCGKFWYDDDDTPASTSCGDDRPASDDDDDDDSADPEPELAYPEPELAYPEPEPTLEPEPRESESEPEPTPIVRAKRGIPSKADIEARKTLNTITTTTPIRASKRSKKL